MDKLPTTVTVPTISSAQTASNYVLYRRYVIQLKFLAALKGEDEGEAIKNLARFFFHEPNCSMKYRLICIYYDDPSRLSGFNNSSEDASSYTEQGGERIPGDVRRIIRK